MVTIKKEDLMKYVFGSEGLAWGTINKEAFAWWLKEQYKLLENIKKVEEEELRVEETETGYVPYALGDLQNLIQLMVEKLGATIK